MRTHYYFDEMIKLARNILSDSWNVHYVNVEDEDFDDPLVNYYEYKKEEE